MHKYGGFKFHGEGYQYYKYPTAETFPLNRALATLERDGELRGRFARDMDGVIAEFGLSDPEGAALKTFSTAARVEQGGHGVISLSTMLAVQMSAKEVGIDINAVA